MESKFYFYIFIASLIWGTSFPMVTVGLRYTTPEMLLFLRFLLATVIGFLMFPGSIKCLKDKDLIIVGLFNALGYLIQFIGQQYVPAGQASILVNFYAVIVPITAFFILNEKPQKIVFFAVIIGFLGVILLVGYQTDGAATYDQYLLGAFEILISGILWAFYVVFSKKILIQHDENENFNQKYSNQDVFNASMFYTALTAFISILFIPNSVSQVNVEFIVISIYLGLFPTVIAFLLYLISLQHIKATTVSIILLSQVIVAYIISIIFLHELIGILQVIGTGFILMSIYLVLKTE